MATYCVLLMQHRALGPSECFGISGFTAKWLLRVVGLPTVLGVVVLVVWTIDKYRIGPVGAQINMKGNVRQLPFSPRQLCSSNLQLSFECES